MSVKKLGKGSPKWDSYIDEHFPRFSTFNNLYWQVEGGGTKLVFDADLKAFIPRIAAEIETVRQQTLKAEKSLFGRIKRPTSYYEAIEGILKRLGGEIQLASIEGPLLLRMRERRKSVLDPSIGSWQYCLYRGNIYKFDRAGYSDEEAVLQIIDLEDRERKRFERLKHQLSVASTMDGQAAREPIPEQVRIAVWRRDSGKCARCGSRERLEYDHIIPLSKNGSNTERNIELLCEQCNRQKSGNIQ